jgi:hypothetical protein
VAADHARYRLRNPGIVHVLDRRAPVVVESITIPFSGIVREFVVAASECC